VSGVRCPYCNHGEDRVVDSRTADQGAAIRRRRECMECRRRYTTFERVEEAALLVRKRSGVVEPFDRRKVIDGVRKAGVNRPALDEAVVVAVADGVEEQLRAVGPQVSSQDVGLAVLDRLRQLDDVAYLRFASVYKGFEDLADFEREARLLQKTTDPKPTPR
jgi:transcriptional repressor NrdR